TDEEAFGARLAPVLLHDLDCGQNVARGATSGHRDPAFWRYCHQSRILVDSHTFVSSHHPQLWREYAKYVQERRMLLVGVSVAGVIQSFSYLPLAVLLRHTFDVVLPARNLGGLGWWIRMAGLRANQDILAQLRKQCIQFLYELPRSFHTAADAESLHYLIVQDANWIESMNDSLMGKLLPAVLSAIVLFGILFWTQPWLAIMIAVCFTALFIVNRLMVRRIWFLQERLRKAAEAFSRGVRFVIMALELTRSQAAEEMEFARQAKLTDNLRQEALDLTR